MNVDEEKAILVAEAKVWQQTGRPQDVFQTMLQVATLDVELNAEERLLLSMACQDFGNHKRKSLKVLKADLCETISAITGGKCAMLQTDTALCCAYCGRSNEDVEVGCDGKLIFRGRTTPFGDPKIWRCARSIESLASGQS